MSHTLALRRLALPASRARTLHSSARAFVKVGDAIPNVELVEKSPGNKVNLSQEIKGRALIIGVPAAFRRHKAPSVIRYVWYHQWVSEFATHGPKTPKI